MALAGLRCDRVSPTLVGRASVLSSGHFGWIFEEFMWR